MRVGLAYIVLLAATLQLLMAESGLGQDLDEIKVTVALEHASLTTLVHDIESQTQLHFAYDPTLLAPFTDITINSLTRSVRETLDLAFTGTALSYRKLNGSILIFKDDNATDALTKSSLNTPGLHYVSGRVTDAKGSAIPGVNILIRGTAEGTVTDADGKYSLQVNETDLLLFTFIGFKRFEAEVGERTIIDVSLEEESATLGEVTINAGYWNVKEKESTGSIATVKAEEISKQPVANPLQALQGRFSGVYITQESGVPGSGFTVQIRGRNSLRSDANEPLYIVDGVPYTNASLGLTGPGRTSVGLTSPFNNIDPNSIESVEVLKDADATAIYGSQGANGVVLIATKKGKAGKTNLTANFSSGISQVPHFIDLLNTQQFIEMRKEAFANDGITSYPSNAYDINGTWDQTRYTDWQRELIGGTGHMTNADVSISGGSPTTRFLLSSSFIRQSTVYSDDFAYQRGALHFNLTHDSENKRFKLMFSTNFSGDKNNLPLNDLTGRSIALPPNAPKLRTATGSLNWENSTWDNPLGALQQKYESTTKSVFLNTNLSYEIVRGLMIKANLGYNTLQMKEVGLNPLSALRPSVAAGSRAFTTFANSGTDNWTFEPQIEYVRKAWIGDLTVFGAATLRQSSRESQTVTGLGYTIEALMRDLTSAPIVTPSSSSNSQYKYEAVYGRINYNIDGKYVINLTARRDGSSRFGPSRQFANFGALGVAWIFSNESFFKERVTFINFAKLRSSFGSAGNDQIGDYQYLETYSSTLSYSGTGTSVVPTSIANPYYAWEVNKKLEVAVELGFFNDAVRLGVNWYKNESSNQLVGQSIPGTTGFLSYQSNLPATVQNQGWEFELTTTNVARNSFKWTSSINFTIPKNILASYPNIETSANAYIYEVGKSIFMQKRLHSLGVDPVTGVYTFEDKDQNGHSFDDADRQALIKLGQDFYGGIRNSLTWKGFELTFFFQFARQTGANYLYPGSFDAPGIGPNEPAFVMNRWTETNRSTSVQKFTASGATPAGIAYYRGNGFPGSDLSISDASFIRLQNASLEWRIPQTILKKTTLSNVAVYVQGQNLLTITKYYGFDPQTTSFTSLPSLRVITVGAKISL
jgi:TonB-linked SusC/RagA family outer membrane protein